MHDRELHTLEYSYSLLHSEVAAYHMKPTFTFYPCFVNVTPKIKTTSSVANFFSSLLRNNGKLFVEKEWL